ncbi:MAG: hypothetical protein A2729_05030 [Candidatus Buchananbacteria bacterium RIFCSPHIGHO2_01_FULL_39_14]|uniref:2'-deoxycytidine 5'-triphosphate deaminase n=1 Tax=Candidatus Buchananbacteria bacterium RIFCSPHIGHO2_01_FULL_39_14 TaxID=1797532 RepID=A0A1G1XSM3_9BACT|nr:MAG: hypothetical protein A2729_05030 [Candidatus Buchananbacteria bacterium RIFCSPHIGHO2_01_FULL_39_14]
MTNNKSGVLPSQELRQLIQKRIIHLPEEYQDQLAELEQQIQPSSLDLTLGSHVYRIIARPTAQELQQTPLPKHSYSFDFPLDKEGKILEKDATYLIPTREQFQNLPPEIRGLVNNKSSSGRINLQTKFTTRYGDETLTNYHQGMAYNRITPCLSMIKAHTGDAINQIRFICGNSTLDDLAIRLSAPPFLYDKTGAPLPLNEKYLQDGLICYLELEQEIIGWKAKRNPAHVLDLQLRNYTVEDFWEPLKVDEFGRLLLEAGEFYILATKEKVSVPPDYALEMIPYDLTAGEFRSHYAGFFDPGFGWSSDGSILGSPATLEVIPYENMYVRDGSVICKFKVEKMRSTPDKIYGKDMPSSYQNQPAPKLAKYFK